MQPDLTVPLKDIDHYLIRDIRVITFSNFVAALWGSNTDLVSGCVEQDTSSIEPIIHQWLDALPQTKGCYIVRDPEALSLDAVVEQAIQQACQVLILRTLGSTL